MRASNDLLRMVSGRAQISSEGGHPIGNHRSAWERPSTPFIRVPTIIGVLRKNATEAEELQTKAQELVHQSEERLMMVTS
ncbi:hypothetical protein AEGHOMDF_4586 [Methylobacterium soli]|nr:hypothetical protein AEGHOMDF_4586 [Methylobacterium soli]